MFPPPSETVHNNGANEEIKQHSAESFYSSAKCHDKSHRFNAISLPESKITYPGETLPIPLPAGVPRGGYISISPSFPNAYDCEMWRPQICEIVNGSAMFKNLSDRPLLSQKNNHFRPHPVTVATLTDLQIANNNDCKIHDKKHTNWSTSASSFLGDIGAVSINKDILSYTQLSKLDRIHENFQEVFNPTLRSLFL